MEGAELSPEESAVEQRAFENLEQNRRALAEAYQAKFGNEISADNAREFVSPEYAAPKEGRTEWSRAVQKPAAALADFLFEEVLVHPEPAMPRVVVMTAGGTGAGKTTALRGILGLADVQFTYDSNLNSKKSSIQKIEAAKTSGNGVVIVFVHRDPLEALTGGVLPRAMVEGHVVGLDAHARMYRDSAENFSYLTRKYAGDPMVRFRAFDNTAGPGAAREMDIADAARIRYSTRELLPKLRAALENEYAQHRISETVYRATLGAATAGAPGGVPRDFGSVGAPAGGASASTGDLFGNPGGGHAGEPEPQRPGVLEPPEARSRRIDLPGRAAWLVLALVLLIRLPFLNQAIQGDDHIYLTEAAHALVEPLSPSHTHYVFLGNEVDLRGHSHPPLDAWALAGLIAIFGGVREVPFHAAYILFSLIAAAAMWSLAQRFSSRPIWAALLFVAVPAFVVNGNSLESDLPFLAFGMAAVALYCADRLALAAVAMALAAMTAYQAIFLTPILAVYAWLYRRQDRAGWAAILVPPATIAAWQIFERLSTGALPASVLSGYFSSYGFQALQAKLASALMLFIHSWFIVFPALVPAAALLAWRKRREPETLFLLAWIGIFFAGAVVVFFAGSARYLLPMAAPVALLASRVRTKWLIPAFAAQLVLGLGLAVENYQHWEGYRQFAASVPGGHRVWVDGEWGLRYYLETRGALPLTKTQRVRVGDIVVSSELGHSVSVAAPTIPIAQAEIRPSVPLRLIGLESHSGYSTCSRGFWPFGISTGVVDRVRAFEIAERHPTLEYLPMNASEAANQIVSGVYDLEQGSFRWTGRAAVVVLKSPAEARPVRAVFSIHPQSPARRVALLVDGREVAAQTYPGPGAYTLESAPVKPAGATATVAVEVDHTFTAPPDSRALGIVLTGVGFAR